MMKLKSLLLFIALVFLAACAGTEATSSTEAIPQQDAPPSSVAGSPIPAADQPAPQETSQSATQGRTAEIVEVMNVVTARMDENAAPQPARQGLTIHAGGSIETGADGRARLDLLPEKTIVRIAPNSSFKITEVTEAEGQPKTTLELLFGKVYILLNGGSLQIQTPSGVASVRGSVMSVEYDPNKKSLKTACLEGHCSVQDDEGNEVDLIDEEISYIFDDEAPTDPETIPQEEFEDWMDEIPEMEDFFDDMPNPEDFPPMEDSEYYNEYFEYFESFDEFYDDNPSSEEDAMSTEEPVNMDDAGGENPAEDPDGEDGSSSGGEDNSGNDHDGKDDNGGDSSGGGDDGS